MSNDVIQNFRPTAYPSILDFTFLDLTRNAAERKKMLEKYQTALADWSSEDVAFPQKDQFWKQHATGLIHRIVTVAYTGKDGSSGRRHDFSVIHETKDGAVFSTDLGDFLYGKIEYSIASHNYGMEIPEGPAFELYDGNWDEPEQDVRRRYRPLEFGKVREKLGKKKVNLKGLWVVNAMRTGHGMPEILIDIPASENNLHPFVAKIPPTWLPIDILQQVPLECLRKNREFFRLLSRGHLRMIRAKFAADIMLTEEARLEHARMIARGVKSDILCKPGAKPEELSEEDKKHLDEAKENQHKVTKDAE